MTYVGSGVPQTLTPTCTPTWAFTPQTATTYSVTFQNLSGNYAFLGQSNVSPFNGLVLPPYSAPVKIINSTVPLYVCSGITSQVVAATMNSTQLKAGATAFTISTSVSTIGVGSTVVIASTAGSTVCAEVLTVTGSTAGTAYTVSTATLYDHAASSIVYTATPTYAQVSVVAGVVG